MDFFNKMYRNYLNNKIVKTKNAIDKEMFFFVCSFLSDVGFSSRLNYILLKRQFFRFSLLNGNTKSINLKLKMSRSNFKKSINSGNLINFYRAV